jgi:hypothetical protein
MNGGEVLDQLQMSSVVGVFSEHNKTNDVMSSANSQLSGASMGMGYGLESTTETTAGSFFNAVKEEKFVVSAVTGGNVYTANSVFRFNVDSSNSTTCHLDLSKVFNLLNNLSVISTNVFKQLRIVVEYNDLSKCCLLLNNVNGTAPAYTTTVTAIQRPSLLVDVITNERMASMKEKELMNSTVSYRVLEADQVFSAAAAGGNVLNEKIYGFDTKMLLRIAVFKQNPALLSQSLPKAGERLNLVINGKQHLPYTGVDAKNKNLSYLTTAWGEFGMKGDEAETTKRILNSRQLTDNVYMGLLVGKRVDELIVNYSNTTANTAMNLVVIGEVVKSISFNGGNYTVSYA